MSAVAPSTRNNLLRLSERGVYDCAAIDAILGEGIAVPAHAHRCERPRRGVM